MQLVLLYHDLNVPKNLYALQNYWIKTIELMGKMGLGT